MSLKSKKIATRDKIQKRLYDWKRKKYIDLFEPLPDPDPYKRKEDLEKADADNKEESLLLADIITEEIYAWFLGAKQEVLTKGVTQQPGTPWASMSEPISAGNAGGIVFGE